MIHQLQFPLKMVCVTLNEEILDLSDGSCDASLWVSFILFVINIFMSLVTNDGSSFLHSNNKNMLSFFLLSIACYDVRSEQVHFNYQRNLSKTINFYSYQNNFLS